MSTAYSSTGPTPLACLNCREKHVKCDGKTPHCSRCYQTRLHCQYAPSRRGRKTQSSLFLSAYNPFDQFASSPQSLGATDSNALVAALLPEQQQQHPEGSFGGSQATATPGIQGTTSWTPDLEIPSQEIDLFAGLSNDILTAQNQSQWVQIYYARFHRAHPFLPPEGSLNIPRYLIQAMKCIALHYMFPSMLDPEDTFLSPYLMEAEPSLYKVQAHLLLTILLHSKAQPTDARRHHILAVKAALEIGLHLRDFSDPRNGRSIIYCESARRTWWELVIIDGLLAALQTGGSLALEPDVIGHVLLPCEENVFIDEESCILSEQTIQHLRDNVFADQDDVVFSSFSYRIEAALVLRDVVRAVRNSNTRISPDVFHTLDSRTTSWLYHLPIGERDFVWSDGTFDEMMFQAHLLTHCSIVYLNLPYSRPLSPLVSVNGLICGSPELSPYLAPGISHTAKTIQAAVDISQLSGLSRFSPDHTPFLTCFLVLSSVVHLGALSISAASVAEKHRSLLALNIGILKSLTTVWPLALQSKNHINQAAREMMGIRNS